MTTLNKVQKIIFCPLYPVLLFLFLSITTLHVTISLLVNLHIESLVLLWALSTSAIYFIISEKLEIDYNNLILSSIVTGLLFVSSPLLTSFVTDDQFKILADGEYQTLLKMILFIPCLIQVLKNDKWRELTINSFVIFYSIFAIYFLYRYFILNEVRAFDLRPQLKIRHGDANFLCTFFSMMIPIALMQAWKAKNGQAQFKTIFNTLAALLLLLCSFLTESRMGLIAVLAGLIYLITRPVFGVSKKILTVLTVVGLLGAGISSDRIVKRFTEMNDKSNSDRYLSWKNGLDVFSDYPLFGVGIHKAKETFFLNTGFPHFQSEANPLEVHNTFLKTLAELGIVGFIIFAALYSRPVLNSIFLKSSNRYFLISSMVILTLSILTIGLTYKDLFVLHLYLIAAIATYSASELSPSTQEEQCTYYLF